MNYIVNRFFNVLPKKVLAWRLTKTEPRKWPKQIVSFTGRQTGSVSHCGAATSSKTSFPIVIFLQYELMLMVPFPASTMTTPSPCLSSPLVVLSVYKMPRKHTFIAPTGSPFWIEKCRIASPSVTKDNLACPTVLSGIRRAATAALLISCCWMSSPFGCERTKSISSFKDSQKVDPCVSLMYSSAQENKYLRKSEKTSTTDLLRGRGGMSLPTCLPAPCLLRRWRINLGRH